MRQLRHKPSKRVLFCNYSHDELLCVCNAAYTAFYLRSIWRHDHAGLLTSLETALTVK